MGDWRRYTGTQTLQIGWSVLVVLVVVLILGVGGVSGEFSLAGLLIGGSIGWMIGLVLLGFRERLQWNRMVEHSSFEPNRGTREADLEKLVGGRSVTVSTDVSKYFLRTHTELRTAVEDVDASFTITLECVESGGTGSGVTTGNETLDDQFIIEGSEQNIAKLLSADVQAALMDIDVPGVYTVTGTEVIYEIPFTNISADELELLAETIVTIAQRIEAVAQ